MPSKLDDSIIQYSRLFNKKALNNKQKHLNCIRKKYKLLNKHSVKRLVVKSEKKKQLTISEIFSNSSIIIQKDEQISSLKSIKNELLDTSETTVHCDVNNC